jgi:phosphate ABC transporter permease subunit PstA
MTTPDPAPRRRAARPQDEPSVWLTGGALLAAVGMVLSLAAFLAYAGGGAFWPAPFVELHEPGGAAVAAGELVGRSAGPLSPEQLGRLPRSERERFADQPVTQVKLRLAGASEWFPGPPALAETRPEWGLVIEKLKGRVSGVLRGFRSGGNVVATDPVAAWGLFRARRQAPTPGDELILGVAGGPDVAVPLAEVVRAYPPNGLDFWGKLGVYGDRWREYLTEPPRGTSEEGGVFPALWCTVALTLIMSVLVVPFGVLAALYLREYAGGGPVVSAIRIAINNLAGVPSIVYGVFGLGFFCYTLGWGVDQLFFSGSLPNPTFGKEGLLWASLTLALLTSPVVIVATEEALSAVPNSLREASFACGASKWQTVRRVVLPRAMPGVITGTILAMARGAGEVAPLMLVGAVKKADSLPVDGTFPYFHPQRSFMHLGFHIYDLGFQANDSDAAGPLALTAAFLLVGVVAVLTLLAAWLRARLRRTATGSQF